MPKTVYVTKHALKLGIVETTVVPKALTTLTYVKWKGGIGGLDYVGKVNCFDDFAQAQEKAEKMRERKIASLRKQIAALEALDFSKPTRQ